MLPLKRKDSCLRRGAPKPREAKTFTHDKTKCRRRLTGETSKQKAQQ